MLYDKTREKQVKQTPEEIIRQTLVDFLIEKYNVPESLIKTEFALSQLDPKDKGRLDVIVADRNKGLREPWLIAECKIGRTDLQKLEAQVSKYLRVVKPKYIILAVGIKWYFLSKIKNEYRTIKKLPKFLSS